MQPSSPARRGDFEVLEHERRLSPAPLRGLMQPSSPARQGDFEALERARHLSPARPASPLARAIDESVASSASD